MIFRFHVNFPGCIALNGRMGMVQFLGRFLLEILVASFDACPIKKLFHGCALNIYPIARNDFFVSFNNNRKQRVINFFWMAIIFLAQS